VVGGNFDKFYVELEWTLDCFQFTERSDQRVRDRRFSNSPHLRRRQRCVQLPRSPVLQVREETSLELRDPHRQPGRRRLHRQHHTDDAVHGEHSGRVLAVRARLVWSLGRGRLRGDAGVSLRSRRHLH